MKKFLIAGLLLLINSYLYTQDFNVEFYTSKGMLEKTDLVKKDFGRYKGFEIEAGKGEAGNFVVFSQSFTPSLLLTDEAGNIVKQTAARDKQTAILSTLFPKDGKYVLFMVADSSATGGYEFQYGFASTNSIGIPQNADFKTGLNYLTEHAKAYFLFFENKIEGKDSFYKLKDATDVTVESDGSYRAVFYKGSSLQEAEKLFSSLVSNTTGALGSEWKKEEKGWIADKLTREKSVLFKTGENRETRTVNISLYDFSNAKNSFKYSYGVSLIIAKEH